MSNKPWVKFHWLRSGHFKPSSNPLCFTSTIRPIHYFQELLPLDKAWARFLDEHFCQIFLRRCLVFVFDLFFLFGQSMGTLPRWAQSHFSQGLFHRWQFPSSYHPHPHTRRWIRGVGLFPLHSVCFTSS